MANKTIRIDERYQVRKGADGTLLASQGGVKWLTPAAVGLATEAAVQAGDATTLAAAKSYTDIEAGILDAKKVDKVAGKQLSTEDYTTAEKTKLAGIATGATANATNEELRDRATHTGTQAISTVANLQSSLDNKADLVGGKVPESQLPSFVDDVLTYNTAAGFPATGEDGKIYIAKDTNLTYRWTGSAYAEISPSLALGETSSTAYRGDRGKTAYDHTLLTGNPHGVTKAQVGLGNVPNTDFTADVTANTSARHTHSNKATLDATTASFTTAQETKLSGIATGATANATNAQLRDRSTHTGTQAQSTITNLTTDLAAKANASATVNLTGDQTVAGVKTFSSSPVVPTATTGTQAVNKSQMDTALSGKVDKSTTASSVYAVNGSGNQTMVPFSAAYPDGSIAQRSTGGTLAVGAPTSVAHATPKGYVDGLAPIYGTGNPNGIVTATVGRIYSDTTGANNTHLWVKAVGTGNTGWQIVPKSTTTANITVSATAPTNPVIGDLWVIA